MREVLVVVVGRPRALLPANIEGRSSLYVSVVLQSVTSDNKHFSQAWAT